MRSLALPLIVAILAFAVTYLLQRRLPAMGGLAEAVELSNLLINVLVLVIALASLFVAVAAYRDAAIGGKQQQAILEDSRKALESVVGTLKEQQKTNDAQLSIIREQNEAEKKRLARKPVIELTIGTVSAKDLDAGSVFPLLVDAANAAQVDFVATNVGEMEAQDPVAVLTAEPPVVWLDHPGHQIERDAHNTLQLPSQALGTKAVTGGGYNFRVAITVPPGTDVFAVTFKLSGRNLPAVSRKITFRAERPPPPKG